MDDAEIGIVAGLGAALAWAASSMVFSRLPMPAAAMNLFKNGISAVLLVAILAIPALKNGTSLIPLDGQAWWLLGLSALIGIVVGDTCYFRSLQILGARRSLVLTTLTPPFSAFFGWTMLDEIPGALVWLGIVVLLSGVVIVIRERGGDGEAPGHYPGSTLLGVLYGLVGSISQALGAAWSKQGIQALPGESTVEATFIRLVSAAVIGVVLGLGTGVLRSWGGYYRKHVRWLIPASLCGTCLGIWCSLLAFKYTEVAVATTLTSMTPIFVLPLVWVFFKQRISLRAALGALVAVLGVAILASAAG